MEKTKPFFFYLKVLLIFGSMFGIGMLPPFGQITPFGMKILGIFIGCIIGWGFGQVYFTSMLGLILTLYVSNATFADVFSVAWGNQNLLIILFSLVFCYGISETGIIEYVASWILSRKFATKGIWNLSFAFWLATCVGSAVLCNNLVVIILLWTMYNDIVNRLGVSRDCMWVQATMIIMCVVGYTGCVTLPFNGWTVMGYAVATNLLPGMEINVLGHTVLLAAINTVLLIALFLVFKFILGRNETELDLKHAVTIKKEKMTKQQAIGMLFLIGLMVALLAPTFLPKDNSISMFLNHLGIAGIFIAATVLLTIVRVDGEPVFDPIKAMKNVEWNIIFVVFAALFIAGLIPQESTGISATILTTFKGLTEGLGLVGIFILFIVVGCIATNIMNNVVCMNLFLPIGILLVADLGGPVGAFTSILMMVLYLGLALPSGSVIGALMHGNTEWLKPKNIYLYASLGCAVVVIVAIIIGIPLANIFYS